MHFTISHGGNYRDSAGKIAHNLAKQQGIDGFGRDGLHKRIQPLLSVLNGDMLNVDCRLTQSSDYSLVRLTKTLRSVQPKGSKTMSIKKLIHVLLGCATYMLAPIAHAE